MSIYKSEVPLTYGVFLPHFGSLTRTGTSKVMKLLSLRLETYSTFNCDICYFAPRSRKQTSYGNWI